MSDYPSNHPVSAPRKSAEAWVGARSQMPDALKARVTELEQERDALREQNSGLCQQLDRQRRELNQPSEKYPSHRLVHGTRLEALERAEQERDAAMAVCRLVIDVNKEDDLGVLGERLEEVATSARAALALRKTPDQEAR